MLDILLFFMILIVTNLSSKKYIKEKFSMSDHLEIFEKYIFNLNWWKETIWNYLSTDKVRLYFCIFLIYLHLRLYLTIPQRHSAKGAFSIPKYSFKKGWSKKQISYITKYYILYGLMLLIDILFLFSILVNLEKIPNKLFFSDYDTIIIIGIIVLIILYNIKKLTKPALEIGTFVPPPKYIPPKKNRIRVHTILLVLYAIHFFTEFTVTHNPKDKSLEQLFLSRFGSLDKKDPIYKKIAFIGGWLRLIGLILEVISYNTTRLYASCKYMLPNSWEF